MKSNSSKKPKHSLPDTAKNETPRVVKYFFVVPRWSKAPLLKFLQDEKRTEDQVSTWAELDDGRWKELYERFDALIMEPRHRCEFSVEDGGEGPSPEEVRNGCGQVSIGLENAASMAFDRGTLFVSLIPGPGYFSSIPFGKPAGCICPQSEPRTIDRTKDFTLQSGFILDPNSGWNHPLGLRLIGAGETSSDVPVEKLSSPVRKYLKGNTPHFYIREHRKPPPGSSFIPIAVPKYAGREPQYFAAAIVGKIGNHLLLPCQKARLTAADRMSLLAMVEYILECMRELRENKPAVPEDSHQNQQLGPDHWTTWNEGQYVISFVPGKDQGGDFYVDGELIIFGKDAPTQIKLIRILYDTFEQAFSRRKDIPRLKAKELGEDLNLTETIINQRLGDIRKALRQRVKPRKGDPGKILHSNHHGWHIDPSYVTCPSRRPRRRTP